MAGKARPSLRAKTLANVERSNLSNTDKECIRVVFKRAEVKHSRWENISGFDVCNICGTSPAYCEPKPNNPKGYPPYCHNCGAKMDGKKEGTT
jgi:hypothetical protein